MTLADLIFRNAAFAPGHPALQFDGAVWSYAAFAARIRTVAAGLARNGVRHGDRLAVLALNHPDTLAVLYACATLGAMLVPLNWRLAVPELAWILGDAEAGTLIVAEQFAGGVPDFRRASPGMQVVGLDFTPAAGIPFTELLGGGGAPDLPQAGLQAPLLIMYTSGTTGRPKGAVLPQSALLWNGVMSQHMHGMTSSDRVLTVLPFFHVGALNIQTTAALHLGATVLIHTRFDAAATLRAIQAERPTLTVLVPATMQAVIGHPAWPATDLSSLRAVATGSSLVPRVLSSAFEARGVPVLEVYGSTETCPVSIYVRLGAAAPHGSTGHPGLVCEARVVDADARDVPPGALGEVLLRGPHVFTEYWRNPAATREALREGWFHTGDIGARAADGSFTIHDRKKNMIISGGENVYPAEIERVLLDHPDVAECAVIGEPHPKWQEVPLAYVVARRPVEAAALIVFLSTQLARFKVPREVRFIQALPRNAMGKVQHFRLRPTP